MAISIARHHAEWLSLIEISGPFLSVPVLQRAFPQELDAHDPELAWDLHSAYEEWLDNQSGLSPEPAIHTAWIGYVLTTVLGWVDEVMFEGQAISDSLKAVIPEQGETLRPDILLADPGTRKPRLLVKVYPARQDLEKPPSDSLWQASAATRMMELLHATEVQLGLITNGKQWMLVNAPRGETTGFATWDAEIWLEEPVTLRAFCSLLSVSRFFNVPEDQTLAALLTESAKDQQEVTDQLGYQVRRAVEILIQSLDRADQDRGRTLLTGIDESVLFEAALTVMMRLVFLLAAEERGLLLLGDPIYDQNYAIATLRGQQRELADRQGEEVLERRYDAWSRLLAAFRAVYAGIQHENLLLPAYGGSLFDPDRFPFLEGRPAGTSWRATPASPLPISNRTVLHLLEALQLLQIKFGGLIEARRLSFRALDIEQIGHVYEGLLDHKAARADEPVVGLVGTKDKQIEVELSQLENRSLHNDFLDWLKEQTGRSVSALRKALDSEPDMLRLGKLRAACNNDDALFERVLPLSGLVRDDDYGTPLIVPAGGVYVTAGATRRATGTHYTPRSLTEPIVQHTLEPLVYVGPAEGAERADWQLKTPAELLNLKICDMAMGSGAFLVQVCRYLSERLVEAWEQVAPSGIPQITPEGQAASGDPAETLIPTDRAERLIFARRLVADRCLYGVDKNPLAVEMAKLSLWLITLDKGRAFTFLDHALKCGDSLVGVSLEQLRFWSLHPEDGQPAMIGWALREEIDAVIALRRRLETFPVLDIADHQRKADLLAQAERQTDYLRLAADHLIAEAFTGAPQTDVLNRVIGKLPLPPLYGLDDLRPFHWNLEFPEVFLGGRGGFDGFVGNPPFLGGTRISTLYGLDYLTILKEIYSSFGSKADLCSMFFLRGFNYLALAGNLGFIATNTISQSDTREAGLDHISELGGIIFRADKSIDWPGQAAVSISKVYITKNKDFRGTIILDDNAVMHISTTLDDVLSIGNPYPLDTNSSLSFNGSKVNGIGFVLSYEEANTLLETNSRNRDVIFPYLSGEDLNSHPTQLPSREIINFFDWPLEKAELYVECMAIVRERVYPERKNVRRDAHRKYWWHYGDKRPGLYQTMANMHRVLVIAETTKYCCFSFQPTNIVISHMVKVIASERFQEFALLSSGIHESWTRQYCSTLGNTLKYNTSDAFETFPFPPTTALTSLESVGETYYETRRQIMLTRWEGLTDTYNRFHDPAESAADIDELRRLHVEMDYAVAAAYGWSNLELGHDFHDTAQGVRYTIHDTARREVLKRLLTLNHERYAEEVHQGLHDKKSAKGKRGKKSAESDNQMELL